MLRLNKRIILTLLIVSIIVGVIAIPKIDWGKKERHPTKSSQRRQPSSIPVEATIVQYSQLDDKLTVTGTILANETTELKSESGGRVTSIYFEDGEEIKKGTLLLKVNDEEIIAQIAKEKINHKLYTDIKNRQEKLFQQDVISYEEYNNSLSLLLTTKAEIAVLTARLAKTKVRAPFDGIIGFRQVSPGSLITTNTLIATLYDVKSVKIIFSIPSQYYNQLYIGQPLSFFKTNDKKAYQGKIYAIEPQIDLNTRMLKIRALADNTSSKSLPGQYVRIELTIHSNDKAIVIPTEALVSNIEGHKVYINRGNKAHEIKVTVGNRTDKTINIVEGLHPNDTVITTGILQIRPSTTVNITHIR